MAIVTSTRPGTRSTVVLIALLSVGFGLLAFASALTKSATADEPLHAVAGFVRLHAHDFRIDPEDPPLFSYWAMLPHGPGALRVDGSIPAWDQSLRYMWQQWQFVRPTLYQSPGVDPEGFVNRSRAMMTLLGVVLAALVAWWAWDLGGRWAALIAAGLYCLDPNFLGHAPLIKNDVPITLITAGLMFAIYRAGQRLTVRRGVAVALLMAAAVTVKFSGPLIVVIGVVLLIVRALIDRPWLVFGSIWVDRLNKLGVVLALAVFGGAMSYVSIWACYGFRFAPTPDPSVRLNLPLITLAGMANQLANQSPDSAAGFTPPTAAQAEQLMKDPPAFVNAINWFDDREILPHAYLAGLLDTWATTHRRSSFLLGEYRADGWWYYFPLAMLFKTPVATIAAVALASALSIHRRFTHRPKRFDRWAIFCIALPVAIYAASAMSSNLNLGLRHVLPLYPFIFVWTAATLAQARAAALRAITFTTVTLLIGLCVETLAACPHYVAFFNIPSGGSRGGLKLLGDSNLDWGQDMTLLRTWQRDHPDVRLHLSFFGGVDPLYFVDALPFDTRALTYPRQPGEPPGQDVLAISATNLQGIYPPTGLRPIFEQIRRREPIAVLGGTIYLYRLPLEDSVRN